MMKQESSEHLFACIYGLPAYQCTICNFTSDLKVNLIDHAVQVHNRPQLNHNVTLIMKKFECKNCNLQTYSFLLFKLHHCKRNTKITENKEIGRNTNMKRRRRRRLYTTKDYFSRIQKFRHIERHMENNTDLFACKNDLDVYNCRICDFTTNLHVLLQNHILKAHKALQLLNYSIESFSCNVCNYQTFSVLMLYQHVCKSENRVVEGMSNRVFHCTLCSHKYKWPQHLRKHFRRKHPTGTMLKCDRCKFTCVDRTHFRRHLKRHPATFRQNDVIWYYCKFCEYKSIRSWDLKSHTLLMHEDDHRVEWFRCEQCDFKNKKKSNLTAHVKRSHSGRKNIYWFECTHCEFKSSTGPSLQNHLLEQHGETGDVSIQCKDCDFKTISKTNMHQHRINEHSDDKEIKCELCERKFKHKIQLKRHVWDQHIDGKTSRKCIQCIHCQYQTKYDSHMKDHLLYRHTNDRDINWFHCKYCEYKSKYVSSVRRHESRKHPQ